MNELEKTLAKPLLFLDGATGTELDRCGVDISLPLWSARAIMDAPDQLRAVHESFLRGGADIITAATFRTHRRSLAKAGLGDRAAELTAKAVGIASSARNVCNAHALVAGSVAPLEECYRPDLAPDEATCRAEHGELIGHLLDGGADLILIETMNCLRESQAAATAAHKRAPGRWMISFCMHHEGPPGALLSGESVASLLPELEGAIAVGVNCVAATATEPHVRFLREHAPPHVRIASYANIGYADDQGRWISTDAVDPRQYAAYAGAWLDAGASIIGGCCGTTPDTIEMLGELSGR